MFKTIANWLVNSLSKASKKDWLIQLSISLLTVLPVILVAAFSYIKAYKNLTDVAMSRRKAIAQLSAITLKEKLDGLTALGASLASRERFRQLISEGKWTEAIEISKSAPRGLASIDRVFLTDPTGTLMADAPELPGTRGKNFAFRDWYQGMSGKWERYVSEIYKRTAEPRYNVIAAAVPIREERKIGSYLAY